MKIKATNSSDPTMDHASTTEKEYVFIEINGKTYCIYEKYGRLNIEIPDMRNINIAVIHTGDLVAVWPVDKFTLGE